MKIKYLLFVGTALCSLFIAVNPAFAQGTAFTYQGRLNDGTNSANGTYDLRFALFDAASGGSQVGTAITNSALAISGGVYTVTLDYGAGIFTGAGRWLEMSVRTNGGGAFTTLIPRQPVTPAPYAIFANTASNLSGTLPVGGLAGTYSSALTLNNAANQISGTFSGNGAGVSNISAATLGGLASSSFWKTAGNAGTMAGTHFLGTTDNQPLEFKVNGLRALRLEDNGDSAADSGTTPDGAPNLIGGSPFNFVGAGIVGATIGGGGATNSGGTSRTNSILSDYGVIGGGRDNTITSESRSSTITGGDFNSIGTNSRFSSIGGGAVNSIGSDSYGSTIAGGGLNSISNITYYSSIGGGLQNTIASFATNSTIAGGNLNDIGEGAMHNVIGGGVNNDVGQSSGYNVIGGGAENTIATLSFHATIPGGQYNNIANNTISCTIAGGFFNAIGASASYSAIGGGSNNTIATSATCATIPGGTLNSATNYAFAAGRRAKANHQGTFVWGDSNDSDIASTNTNSVTMRAAGGYRLFSNSGATAGVSLAAGGTAWAVISDRNVKKNFQSVNCREVLEQLAALPVTRWHYQWEADGGVPHLGPMAQDFKSAFYPGSDDKYITTQEADGVALAAIQGLNQKLEEQRAENTELKLRLEKLEQLMNHKNGGAK